MDWRNPIGLAKPGAAGRRRRLVGAARTRASRRVRVWHRAVGTPSSMPEPTVIAPEGELDVHATPALAAQLNEVAGADDPHLIIDLSAVTLLDSTALGAIVEAQHRITRQGRRLSVVAPHGSTAAVLLELTGLRSHLSVFGSRDAALT
jgi:anti-sigma B factor antagonist